jgi:hypothetical protein
MDELPECARCGEPVEKEDSLFYGDPATYYEKKPLCQGCYRNDQPVARIYYGKEESPCIISLSRNETDGEFSAEWKSVGPRGGYYDVHSKVYSRILSDSILSCHESEQMLKDLNDRLINLYSASEIDFARAFTQTSNVFSEGLDFWVRNDIFQILRAHTLLEKVKAEVNYYDPLYSTGILIPRSSFRQLQKILSGKYSLRDDHDLLKLMEEKGAEVIQKVSKAVIKGSGMRDKKP